jgi:hypothetical protein
MILVILAALMVFAWVIWVCVRKPDGGYLVPDWPLLVVTVMVASGALALLMSAFIVWVTH